MSMAKYKGSLRERSVARLIQVAIALSQRSYSVPELAKKFDVSLKTSYRDIDALGAAEIPVIAHPNTWPVRYSVDKEFMKHFL